MPLELEKLNPNKYLIFFLLVVVFVLLVVNMFDKHVTMAVTDLLYVLTSGGLLVLSIIIATRFGATGDHGKAYQLFAGFAGLWFTAELVWMFSELTNVPSSLAIDGDWLYLGGYFFLFLFSIYYLKPMMKAISNKMLAYAFLATITFLVPTLYATYSYNPTASLPQIIWAGIYPVADSVVLFPAVLGMMLFFKGQVNFFWSLACLAIILNIVADSGFLFLHVDQSYYSGHPLDILYAWSYILFSFGIYSHVKLYKKRKMKSYNNIEDLK